MSALLAVQDLVVDYGKIRALKGLTLEVAEGELVAVIGSNGAGKTTLMRTISSLLRPTSGSITFEGKDLVSAPAHEVVRRGIAHVPEGRRVFAQQSVRDNLILGAFLPLRAGKKAQVEEDLERMYTTFPRLRERQDQLAGTLSGGEQQMLAIARALVSRPKLLLLDEPSMGLAPQFIQQIFRIITEINKQGTTVLLVEQNAQQALSRAHRAYVLETGRITKSGTGKELLADNSIKEAYLGVG